MSYELIAKRGSTLFKRLVDEQLCHSDSGTSCLQDGRQDKSDEQSFTHFYETKAYVGSKKGQNRTYKKQRMN